VFALRSQLLHDPPGGHDAGVGVLVAQEQVLAVLGLEAEAALGLGDVHEVDCIGEGLTQVVDLAVLDVVLSDDRVGIGVLIVSVVHQGFLIELYFAVEGHSL